MGREEFGFMVFVGGRQVLAAAARSIESRNTVQVILTHLKDCPPGAVHHIALLSLRTRVGLALMEA